RGLQPGADALFGTLIVAKVEQLVVLNRPSQTPAKLVPFKWGSAVRFRERVSGKRGAIAQVFKGGAVQRVATRFRDGLDDRGYDLPELRIVAVGDYIHFRDGVGRRNDYRRALNGFVVVDAVNLPVASS